MPGGLSVWLDDDSSAVSRRNNHKNKGASSNSGKASSSPQHEFSCPRGQHFSDSAACSAHIAVIDVDMETSGTRACSKGIPVVQKAPLKDQEKVPWDPFASGTEDTREDAFARLLNRRSSASKTRAAKARVGPSTPMSSDSSSWNPFAVDDGKENRATNAFLKLLSPRQQNGGTSTSSTRGSKRKRTLGSSCSSDPKAAATTKFCECPVCGEKVVIELCSKHLDTECRGPNLGSSGADSRKVSTRTAGASKSPPPSTTVGEAARTPLAFKKSPAMVTPSDKFASPGSPKRVSLRAAACSKAAHSTDYSAAAPIGSSPGTMSCGEDSLEEDFTGRPRNKAGRVQAEGGSPPPASVIGTTRLNPPPALRRRIVCDSSAVSATSSELPAVTSCPVCGKRVRADICSLHLDTDCSGVSCTPLPSDKGGVAWAGDAGNRKRMVNQDISSEGAKAEGEQGGGGKETSATAEGLMALAAELTCPVCLCLFEDAHVLPCSHRFCLECINGCFRSTKKQECPLCKVPAWKRDLKRDVPLRNILLAYRRMTS